MKPAKEGAAREAGPAPRDPALVRNVALVGHSGAGKTTLVEALLLQAGAIPRAGRVEDGTTTTDHEPAARRQQRSVGLGVACLEHAGVQLNLVDTPGHPDFVGELRAGLRAVDAVLFVVSAAQGVDAVTQQVWEECAAVGMPRALVVTQVDRPRTDFDDTVAICQRLLGEGVLPLQLPLHDSPGRAGEHSGVHGLLDLVTLQVVDHTGGGRTTRPADPEHVELVAAARAELVEAVIAESEDETLLDRYLAGEEVDQDVLVADLEKAVAQGRFHPVLLAAAPAGLGVAEVLDLLVRGFPSPLEHPCPVVTRPDGGPAAPVTCDPAGPLVAEVVRTSTEPYVGRVSLLRVFSGTLRPDSTVHVSGHGLVERGHPDHDADEHVGPLAVPLGAALRPVPQALAGSLVALTRLATAETGDTLSSPDEPLLVHPWNLPDPQLPVAVEAASRADEDKMAVACQRLAAEDPTVRIERDLDTGQLVLWCVGDAHADVLLDRLEHRHGVTVRRVEHRVPRRETLARAVTVTGRLVKQSGGHGQYAVVVLEVAPGPPGSGLVFGQRVVGGSVPAGYHGSVERGVRDQMARGVRTEHGEDPHVPLVDLEVTLVDGKTHSVDSSDAAFQAAGALAVREAVAAAGTVLLEPVSAVEVTVPQAYVGTVMSDLSGRRARVTGSEPHPQRDDHAVVRAEVPDVELQTYATHLRSLSHGTGRFSRRHLGYEPAASPVGASSS